ncbi:FKBP-type peptidyl-prolyl cis-trans isomerase N-terminal domain-containing protein [Fibrobacter sp. UWH1]|uniref:FKBP-type peptidyl-prolyl cis-trans isomerase N-terminal domain-containing protein n=1 Tax=Fibrobacter sp. UWH1 TaxID=1964354 RepID=UPI000B52840B|nr:FKBP-type peptidyl-prolyl cis-trans isomerase N-terminal domain-containing protein [Fibrobacter sp. UWH1]MDO4947848.1 FKBP-type peptidyl-prolyl cis-trans isomerase N-terminal domain-containing protein [Fibrobacter sp.]OWV15381.1 redoxin [Fibrobacter sp. UWH1]
MNMKKFALGAAALALVACNEQAAKKVVAIDANSTDDQKFAYMLGAQFGGQNATFIPRQMGEELYMDAVVQGVRDMVKASKDTSFKPQMTDDSLQAVGGRYTAIARNRAQATRPDSATFASFEGDQQKMRAWMDSATNALPVVAAQASTGANVTINAQSSDNAKFSYLIGMQFGNQLNAIGGQFDTSLDEDYFILGIKEAAAKVKDTTLTLQLPQDSLAAVGQRYQQKAQELRQAAMKKQQEEQEKVKAAVAELRGDTLANGMPKLMNYKVPVTGVTGKSTDLSDIAGKSALVFYFSATCGHCQHAAPQILDIAKEFASTGLTTLAVASGGNNKVGIRKFMDNAKWDETINVVWDETREFGELYSDGYVPKVYLVNPDGTYKLYGSFESEKETLKTEIAALLKGTPVVWTVEAPKAAEAPAEAPAAPAAPAPAAK